MQNLFTSLWVLLCQLFPDTRATAALVYGLGYYRSNNASSGPSWKRGAKYLKVYGGFGHTPEECAVAGAGAADLRTRP